MHAACGRTSCHDRGSVCAEWSGSASEYDRVLMCGLRAGVDYLDIEAGCGGGVFERIVTARQSSHANTTYAAHSCVVISGLTSMMHACVLAIARAVSSCLATSRLRPTPPLTQLLSCFGRLQWRCRRMTGM